MAEQEGDKTEAPTPRRRQEAREQGKVARSQDLVSSASLLAMIILLGWTGQKLMGALRMAMADLLSGEVLHNFDPAALPRQVIGPILRVGQAMLPLAIGLIVVSVMVNIVQVGLHATPERLQPNFASLNPLNGVKRLFSGGHGAVQLGFNLVKMTLVGFTAYSAVAGKMGLIVNIAGLSQEQILGLASTIIYDITFRIAVLLLVLAILDYAWQKFRFERDLRMSKQEIKDEMKRMEGDPVIKQRRRQIQMQRAMGRIRKDVPTADVIVTNPTHFAVALKYDDSAMGAPRVVAKGADYLAMKIREIAVENGIPIIERPPLARALYKDCEIGQEIPEQFYAAVAEILAYVYELTGRKRSAVSR
ncbi:MAG: flagellar biosynthesis protein FlhB [Tepidisphaeraceae bacterium]